MTAEGVSAPAPRLWTQRTAPVVVATLALMTFVAFESLAVVTVLPVVMDDLGDRDSYSFAFAATITTGLVGMILGGNWADRVGFRIPLTAGGLMFIVGIVITAAATDTATFIGGRLMQGIGGGIDSVVIYVVIAKMIDDQLRPKVFGLLVAAWLVPSLVGPIIAGALTEQFGWRIPFVVVAIGAAAAVVTLLVVTRGHGQHEADRTVTVFGRSGGTAIIAAGAILALHYGSDIGQPRSAVWSILCLAVLLVAAARLLPDGTLRARVGIPRLVALRGLLAATVAAADIYLPPYLQYERDLSPTAAGLIVSIGAIGWLAGSWLQGRRGDTERDNRILLCWAAVLVCCGPTATLLYVLGLVSLAAVVAGCIIMGSGMGIAYPRLTATVLALSAPNQYGGNSSSLQAADSMASAAFLAITGALLAAPTPPGGYSATYLLVVLVAIVAVATAARGHGVAAGRAIRA